MTSGHPTGLHADLRTKGFAITHDHLDSGRLRALQDDARSLVARFVRDGYRSEDYWSYDDAGHDLPMLYRIHHLERQGARRITDFVAGALLRRLAAETLGTSAQPTAAALIVKTPGVAGVPWHRDRTNVPPATAINLSLFLQDATPENGCIEVVPGSHLLADDSDVDTVRRTGPILALPARRGDILLHDVRLVHGSGRNPTTAPRHSIIVEFDRTASGSLLMVT